MHTYIRTHIDTYKHAYIQTNTNAYTEFFEENTPCSENLSTYGENNVLGNVVKKHM
jgi:hypothetical protein